MRIEKKDIESIAKENCFNEICFDKWIAFEHRRILCTREELEAYHYDIIACLEHLKLAYEKGIKRELNVSSQLDDIVAVALYQARDLYAESEKNAGMTDDAMLAYDIFYLLRDTQNYLQNQLSWKVMNKWY